MGTWAMQQRRIYLLSTYNLREIKQKTDIRECKLNYNAQILNLFLPGIYILHMHCNSRISQEKDFELMHKVFEKR